MPKKIQNVSIFLSSPSNLSLERQIAQDACDEINLDLGKAESFRVELMTWDSHVRPALGASAQSVINEQIGLDYDIYLGMLGYRFGTPTAKWGSGTEEEFRLALESAKVKNKPEIMFYFGDTKTTPAEIVSSELMKVEKFRTDIGELGVLYWQFSDSTQLKTLLLRHLSAAIRIVLKSVELMKDAEVDEDVSPLTGVLSNWQNLLSSDDEIAAQQLLNTATRDINLYSADLQKLSVSAHVWAKDMLRGNQTIRKFSLSNSASVKSSLRAISSMREKCSIYYKLLILKIPSLSKNFDGSLTNAQRAINILKANDKLNNDEVKKLFENVQNLKEATIGIRSALETLDGQIGEAAWETPFVGKDLKIVSYLHRDLAAFVDNAIATMEEFQQSIEESL